LSGHGHRICVEKNIEHRQGTHSANQKGAAVKLAARGVGFGGQRSIAEVPKRGGSSTAEHEGQSGIAALASRTQGTSLCVAAHLEGKGLDGYR